MINKKLETKNDNNLHIQLNWFEKIIISLSISSIVALLVSLIYCSIFPDFENLITFLNISSGIQTYFIIFIFIFCLYQLFSIKRIKNINKQKHTKLYFYRFLFLLTGIVLGILISITASQLVDSQPIVDHFHQNCDSLECTLGPAIDVFNYYSSMMIAIFTVLITNISFLTSCYLADVFYSYRTNKLNQKNNQP